jgi:SAM-dependent methyltransferase
MMVLEPGPGMGFFTLELARLVGTSGRVVAIDVQNKMIDRLKRRALKAGLLSRVDARISPSDSLGVQDLRGMVDFTLAFAVVHEFPDSGHFFAEVAAAAKPGATMLLAEPKGHVKPADFDAELAAASVAGFKKVEQPPIRGSHTALLKKI